MGKNKLDVEAELENECIGDLKRTFISGHEHFQDRMMFSPSQAAGSTTVAWYRGRLLGEYEACKALRRKYPKAAAYLFAHFGLNKDGSRR